MGILPTDAAAGSRRDSRQDGGVTVFRVFKQLLIILTFDRDYGELIFKYQKENPPAVVYFRSKGKSPIEAGRILFEKIKEENIILENFFTVVETAGIRQRKVK